MEQKTAPGVLDRMLSPLSNGEGNNAKLLISLIPFATVLVLALIKFGLPGKYYRHLIMEDGIVEYGTFIAYLVGFFIALSIVRCCKKEGDMLGAYLYFVLAAGFFFIAMEEISWGQRILNYKTPASFQQLNHQHEANLHNMWSEHILHGLYILIGFYGTFIRLIQVFDLGRMKTAVRTLLRYTAPDAFIAPYFFPVFLFYFYFEYLRPLEIHFLGHNVIYKRFIQGSDQEPLEFILSLGFLLFVAVVRHRKSLRPHAEVMDADLDAVPDITLKPLQVMKKA